VSGSVQLVSALLSGGILALAFPGTGDQGWLAFAALAPLLAAAEKVPWRRAGALGFLAGLMFWLVTIPWVAPTMVRYGGLPWALASVILLGLAGYLAVYWAAFCALLARCAPRSGALYVVVAASLWVALEFLRTYLMSGFPWNLLGYSQHQNLSLIQVAALTGVYGVSFVVVAVNAALARVLLMWGRWNEALLPAGIAALCWTLAVGSGWLWPAPREPERAIPIALVQGNIDQGVKWDPSWQARTLGIYRALTLEAAREQPGLIVWPETAVPFLLQEDPRRRELEALARQTGSYLLVGAPSRRAGQSRNSAFLIDPAGRTLGRFDKRHLVPFGEYVPLRRWLFFVNALAGGTIGEFVPGGEATIFSTPVGRFGVAICYEAIFPGEVREFFLGGADFLVNITNDAWFGRSAAPAQHLAMAAFRAVENRAYLVRAANTGISAIVAPDGRVVRASELFTPAVVSGFIAPRAEVSVYTRYGDLFALGTVAVALAAALAAVLPIRFPGRRAERELFASRPAPNRPRWGRREFLVLVSAGATVLAAGAPGVPRLSPANGRVYRDVARWRIPGGEGRFIAVGPDPTSDELRALGDRLREDFRHLENVVVMVFDNVKAARRAYFGFRRIGDEGFEAALAHHRAMYVKQAGRGEERLSVYDIISLVQKRAGEPAG
jgi:apolipoprotein N-acyltransferase